MDVMVFDRFFTERIPQPVRRAVLDAIVHAPKIAVKCWFDDDDDPCVVMLVGGAAVGERWSSRDYESRCAQWEVRAANALAVTTGEIRSIWTFWDNSMSKADRKAFVARMAVHLSTLERQHEHGRTETFRELAAAV